MNIISPIFQVISLALLGYFITVYFKLDLRTMTRLGLYVFNPALIFRSLYSMETSFTDLLLLMIAYLIFITALLFAATLLCKTFNLYNENKSAFLLATTIANIGAMGIPMVVFAFGEAAAGPAVFIFLMSTIYVNTVGVYLASRGKNDHGTSLLTVFKMPSIYTGIFGLAFNFFNVELPNMIISPIYTLAGAAIPILLILLGGQLSNVQQIHNFKEVIVGSVFKLIFSPILAATVFLIIGLPAAIGKVFIILMAMPTAVNANLLTAEFGGNAEITGGITLFSTLTSILSLSICLWLINFAVVGGF